MIKRRIRKIFIAAVSAVYALSAMTITASANGDVAGAVTSTWTSAKSQIKAVVNNVVFPVIDVILAILLFVKIATCYMECAPIKAKY